MSDNTSQDITHDSKIVAARPDVHETVSAEDSATGSAKSESANSEKKDDKYTAKIKPEWVFTMQCIP